MSEAKVVALRSVDTSAAKPALLDTAALLRNIADGLERGDYGISEARELWPGEEPVVRGALVLRVSGQEPQLFGLGPTTPSQTFMDLHAGATQLLAMQHPDRS